MMTTTMTIAASFAFTALVVLIDLASVKTLRRQVRLKRMLKA
ncbi:MAG: hypothetical protein ACO1NO_14305 [Burkholderiaceae bacterium]